MMNFEEACRTFGVSMTPRQIRKWHKGRGRAYRLAQAFPFLASTASTASSLFPEANNVYANNLAKSFLDSSSFLKMQPQAS